MTVVNDIFRKLSPGFHIEKGYFLFKAAFLFEKPVGSDRELAYSGSFWSGSEIRVPYQIAFNEDRI
jgi:hypothetical protein